MKPLRKYLLVLSALLGCGLAGCIGDSADSSDTTAYIRMLNLSPGYTSIDVYTNNGESDSDTLQISGAAYDIVTGYRAVEADAYEVKFRKSGTTGNLLIANGTLYGDVKLTYVAFGETNEFAVASINDNVEAPNSGYTRVRVLNGTSGRFNAYLTSSGESLDDVAPTISGVAAANQSATVTIASGAYRLRITDSLDKTDLRLDVPQITLASKDVLTIILDEAPGGVLVNAILLPQGGQPTTYDNSESASIRVLNVSRGYDSLDLYSNNNDNTGTDTQRFGNITRGSASGYEALKAGSYTFKFRRSGASGNLSTVPVSLTEGANVTYVAYGALNNFALASISDDTDEPNAGYTRLRVLNTTAADSLDVYLTSPGDSLNDVSATLSAALPGVMSGAVALVSGNYRLRVTAPGSKTDVRLDVPLVTLANQDIVTLVLTDTVGGVPVGAVLMPQQKTPEVFDNVTARIRGAVGLSSGSAVTVSVGSSNILTRRPARSFIADSYTTLPSGNVPVTVYVDDVAVATGTQALQPGRDYTLLVTGSGAAPQLALIADDNHAPPGGYTRLRLLNGMSGLGAPLILSVDYAPVAEYIDVGTASDFAEIAADTDYRLELSNAQTLAPLLTREEVDLKTGGVYTFFAAGGDGGVVVGTLRKDR